MLIKKIYKHKNKAKINREPVVLATCSQLLALEPRLVFDAAAAATVDAVVDLKSENTDSYKGGAEHSEIGATGLNGESSGAGGNVQNDVLGSVGESQRLLSSLAHLSHDHQNTTVCNDIAVREHLITSGVESKSDGPVLITGIDFSKSGPEKEISVTLAVEEGCLFLSSSKNIIVSGNNSAAIVLSGRACDINNLLDSGSLAYLGQGQSKDRLEITLRSEGSIDQKAEIAINASSRPAASFAASPILFGGIRPFGAADWSEPSNINFDNAIFTVDEDGKLVFKPSGQTGIVLEDIDTEDNFNITISVEHGKLELQRPPNYFGKLEWSNDNGRVEFSGTKDEVQALLNSLSYTGHKDYNGTDTLKITVDDGYNTDQEFTHEITINAVPDKPEFKYVDDSHPNGIGLLEPPPDVQNPPLVVTVKEDEETLLLFNYGGIAAEDQIWKPLSVTDPDSNDVSYSDTYTLTLNIQNGTISSSFETFSIVDQASYTQSGLTLAQVNGILANMKFLGSKDFYGDAKLTVSVQDSNLTATDVLAKNFTINVLPVNDPPTITPPQWGG